MNRTLTAAVALAAGLGMAGLAQAQGSSSSAYPSSSTNPGAQTTPAAPSMTSPSSTQATQPGSPGQMPQANAAQPSGAPVAMGRQTIQQAQQELRAQGLYNGPIDGIEGPEMKTAVSQFQRQHGLPASAMLDQQTMSQLMSASGAAASPSTGMTTPSTGAAAPRPTSPTTTTPQSRQ